MPGQPWERSGDFSWFEWKLAPCVHSDRLALRGESALSAPDTLSGMCKRLPTVFPRARWLRGLQAPPLLPQGSLAGPSLPDTLQLGHWLGLSDRDSTPITGHHRAGREKDCGGSNCSSSNGQAAGCPAESRAGWGGGGGKESPGMCDGTKIEGLALLWAKLLPSTCLQGGSGSGESTGPVLVAGWVPWAGGAIGISRPFPFSGWSGVWNGDHTVVLETLDSLWEPLFMTPFPSAPWVL